MKSSDVLLGFEGPGLGGDWTDTVSDGVNGAVESTGGSSPSDANSKSETEWSSES